MPNGEGELRFTAHNAEHLIAALHEARATSSELARIAHFLEQALKRFEAGAEMRQ